MDYSCGPWSLPGGREHHVGVGCEASHLGSTATAFNIIYKICMD